MIASARIRCAKPPGKNNNADNRRHDDHQHDAEGIEQDQAVGGADRALRIKNAFRTASQQEGGYDEARKAGETIS